MSGRNAVLVKLYIAALGAILAATLGFAASTEPILVDVPAWVQLSLLFAIGEYASLFFHLRHGRVGLSAAEAVLIPMFVALTLPQIVIGVIVGTVIVALLYRRVGWLKNTFNVVQGGLAAAAAAGTYGLLADEAAAFSVRDAAAAVTGTLVYAALTHLFTAGAISLAERRSFVVLARDVTQATLLALGGGILVGVLLAAAQVAAPWMTALFPLPLVALYLGYRAVVRQSQERERVEHLHAASRALATGVQLRDALEKYLGAVAEILSASGAFAVLDTRPGATWSVVEAGKVLASLEPVEEEPVGSLLTHMSATGEPSIVAEQTEAHEGWGPIRPRDHVVVPLMEGDEVIGILVAYDRLGAEVFGDADVRLLQAVANELVVALGSYRLFEEVREERERFGRIFNGSKEGIALLDDDGVIQAWNPALARITGFVEEEVLGELWSERVLVRDRDHKRVDGMAIVHVSPDDELEIVTRAGPSRWVSLLTSSVQSGEERQWVVIVRDITAEHELEEAKSDFLSTISHELRTPLTTIKGSLQMLNRPHVTSHSDVGKQMLDIMRRGTDRLERLVMNLLSVSQMEAGTLKVFPDEVDVEKLVRSRAESVLIDHPLVEYEVEEDVSARADKERLGQVIEHLLDNARKFGGPEGMISVRIFKENGYACVSVTDQGPGVPANDQERIFDRFVRLGHVLTRETQGAGVGLFIAKRATEAMNGEVWVESDGRHGSTFSVRIPLARPMALAETPA